MVLTALVVLVPALRFAYRSSEGHLVLETAATLIAGLVAYLLYGRFRRTRQLPDLLLVYSLGVLAVAAFAFVTVPLVAGVDPDSALTTWAPLVVRLAGAALLLAAGLVGHRRVRSAHLVRDAAVVGGVLLLVAGVVAVLGSSLPVAVTEQPGPEQSGSPRLEGHPVVLAVQLASLLCFALAAHAFTRRAVRDCDELAGWLGAAAALGAWARLNYLLYPSLFSSYLYTGDVLRLGFYVLLLVGATREIRSYWSAQAALAVEQERRRLARDLHDGVVQELGYIRTEAHRLGDGAGERIKAAADRALGEARRTVAALAADPDEPLADALERAACEVADRFDVPLDLRLDRSVEATPDRREALVRIAREAVSNAARHGRPSKIVLELRAGSLRVIDDGLGFDPDRRARAGSYGLTSMQDRAAAAGLVLKVESGPFEGTRVEVTW